MEPWRRLDLAAPDEARALLFLCCGSTRWVDSMLERRRFGSMDALLDAASSIWSELTEADWREAFSHHPRIGDRTMQGARSVETRTLSEREQAGVDTASDQVLDALADANREYERRFGYIFIVCATGLTASQMLAALEARLGNDPATEIRIAAAEQAKITAIRLKKI